MPCPFTILCRESKHSLQLEFTNGEGPNKHFSADEMGVLEITYFYCPVRTYCCIHACGHEPSLSDPQASLYCAASRRVGLFCLYRSRVRSSLLQIIRFGWPCKSGAAVRLSGCARYIGSCYDASDDARSKGMDNCPSQDLCDGTCPLVHLCHVLRCVLPGCSCVLRALHAESGYILHVRNCARLHHRCPSYHAVLLGLACHSHHTEQVQQEGFYRKFGFAVGLWTLITPFLVFLNLLVDPWVRFKVVYFASMFFNWWAHIVLTIMYDPKRSWSASFPFHSTIMLGRAKKLSDEAAFDAIAFQRANTMSRQVAAGVSMVTMLQRDLRDFLEEAHESFKEKSSNENGQQGIEMRSQNPQSSSRLSSTLPSDALMPLHDRANERAKGGEGQAQEQETEKFPKVAGLKNLPRNRRATKTMRSRLHALIIRTITRRSRKSKRRDDCTAVILFDTLFLHTQIALKLHSRYIWFDFVNIYITRFLTGRRRSQSFPINAEKYDFSAYGTLSSDSAIKIAHTIRAKHGQSRLVMRIPPPVDVRMRFSADIICCSFRFTVEPSFASLRTALSSSLFDMTPSPFVSTMSNMSATPRSNSGWENIAEHVA